MARRTLEQVTDKLASHSQDAAVQDLFESFLAQTPASSDYDEDREAALGGRGEDREPLGLNSDLARTAQEQNTVDPEVHQEIEAALTKFDEAFNKNDATATATAALYTHCWRLTSWRVTVIVGLLVLVLNAGKALGQTALLVMENLGDFSQLVESKTIAEPEDSLFYFQNTLSSPTGAKWEFSSRNDNVDQNARCIGVVNFGFERSRRQKRSLPMPTTD